MSIQAVVWALGVSGIDAGPKITLIALANYADHEGACYPSQATLARDTSQSERTIRRHVHELEDAGLLRREPQYRIGGGRTSDRYVLTTHTGHLLSTMPPTMADTGCPGDTGQPMSAMEEGIPDTGCPGGIPAKLSGGPRTPGVRGTVVRNLPEEKNMSPPTVTTLHENGKGNGTKPPKARIPKSGSIEWAATAGTKYREHPRYPEFGEAWESYPIRNTAESRRGAFVAWLKLVERRGIDPGAILQAVKSYAEECARENVDPRYVKQFATFVGPRENPWEAYVEE